MGKGQIHNWNATGNFFSKEYAHLISDITFSLFALPISLASSALLTYLLMRVGLRKGALDITNNRSSHTSPVPRGGCLAVVVRNGIARKKYEELSSQEWNEPRKGKLRLCYFGTVGHAQSLIIFARAAKLLQENNGLEFFVVGAGPDELVLRQFVKTNQLTNFHIMKKVPWKDLLTYYSVADVLYAQLRKGDAFSTAEPSKLFEYFSTGKRVIYGGEGLGRELAGQFSNVDVIEPDDLLLLARAICDLQRINLTRCATEMKRVETHFVREKIFRMYIEKVGLS